MTEKTLKQANVVMIATDKGQIHKRVLRNDRFMYTRDSIVMANYIPQHLYLTTDEEINEGGWCVHNYGKGGIEQSKYNLKDKEDSLFEDYKKIIATTNPELWYTASISKEFNIPNHKFNIPKIPQDFIEAYVREQGKIDKVNLEYEVIKAPFEDETNAANMAYTREVLKLRSDNSVIIHKVKEKMYSRDELVEIASKAWYEAKVRSHKFFGREYIDYELWKKTTNFYDWLNKHYPQ